MDLRGHWHGSEALYEELVRRYREPHRRYHTLRHLAECFERLDEYRGLAGRAEEVALALWFHDAIYDPRRDDNEQRSADWARAVLANGDRIHDLVLATGHDAAPADEDAKLVVDIDLWILAAPAPRFDEYEAQVHDEYAWMPWPAYRRGRARLIARFLARESIYRTARFIESYEPAARANLARALGRL